MTKKQWTWFLHKASLSTFTVGLHKLHLVLSSQINFKFKNKEGMPVSYNKCPNKIYMKFNTTNTLTKASWIFKGMSTPSSSSFWSYNKTNKFCSQLSCHMFLMAFILRKANSSFEENTTLQGHVSPKAHFWPFVNFLLLASSEVGRNRKLNPENDGQLPMLFQGRPCQNYDKSGLFSLWTFGSR